MKIRSIRLTLLGLACVLTLVACKGSQSGSPVVGTPTDSGAAQTPSAAVPSADPMAAARLDGMYDVVKKVTAQKNFSDIKVGDTFKRTYNVTLGCTTGPCDGSVEIDAEESKQNITQDVIYDESTRTYAFKSPLSPATCPGVDGKTYKLQTTSILTLTLIKVEASGSEYIVSKFTAVGTLKAAASGAASSKGGCKTATATYKYTGVHQ